MPLHSGATGSELHVPLGYSPDSLVLLAATTDAYRIEDESNNQAFQINTNTDTITIGHNTADTWTLALYGAAVSVDLSDDQATAFVVEERADGTVEYIKVDTSNSAPLITLGNTVNDPVVLINTANVFRLGSATNAERALLTGAGGDLIYDSDDDVIYGYFGATWNDLTPGGGGGGTLDAAYDYGGSGAGRTITADSGTVQIAGTSGFQIDGGIFDFNGGLIDLDPTDHMTLNLDADKYFLATLGTGASTFTVVDAGVNYLLHIQPSAIQIGNSGIAPPLTFETGNWIVDGGAGTSGYVLTSQGSGSTPQWAAASAGAHTLSAGVATTIISETTTGAYLVADDSTSPERLELMPNDISRKVVIGDPDSFADINAQLFFHSGSGASNDYGYIEYTKDSYEGWTIYSHDSVEVGRIAAGWTAIGYSSDAHITYASAFGRQADAQAADSSAFGAQAIAAGGSSVALGRLSSVGSGHTASLAVGRAAATTAANQAVFGSDSYGLNTWYIGQGVSAAAPSAVNFRTTTATTNDTAGASLNIFAGTGKGTDSSIASATMSFYIPHAEATASTTQTQYEYLKLEAPDLDTSDNNTGGFLKFNTDRWGRALGARRSGTMHLIGSSGGTRTVTIPYTTTTGKTAQFQWTAIAMDSTPHSGWWTGEALARNSGGTLSGITGSVTIKHEDDAGWTPTQGTSGAKFQITVTDDTTQDTEWTFYWSILET